jgi:iron complex transport system ATP-binding protein
MSGQRERPPRATAADPGPGAAGCAAWTLDGVSYRYPGAARPALRQVTARLRAGACTALLGPNGSGKSTLLRLLLGSLRPDAGGITLAGQPLAQWSRRDLARTVGVVTQQEEIAFPLTVRELVAMGRYPHLGPFRGEGAADRAAIRDALVRCDVLGLEHRMIDTLSGGERQRARLARALAQQPRLLVLDEPTLSLDVRHEMEIFELLRDLVAAGVTVLLATHNLNLAARYADALLLMESGSLAAEGTPDLVLRRDLLERVYSWPLLTTRHPGPGPDAGAIQVTPLAARPPSSSAASPAEHPSPDHEGHR